MFIDEGEHNCWYVGKTRIDHTNEMATVRVIGDGDEFTLPAFCVDYG